MTKHDEKLKALITEQAAAFFNQQSDRTSMITVIQTKLKNKAQMATVFISVFPTDCETAALAFAKRKRGRLKEFINRHARLKFVPHLEIELITGKKVIED